ncbi:MAG: MFS transporter [Clostridia bacterium]|nr:MFS transporter [Clostridia bacterium]
MLKYKYTKIACYLGYVVQAIACTFLPLLFVGLQNKYNISYEKLGRLMFICFVVQIFVDLISIRLVKLFGYRKLAVASQLFAFVGFISLSLLPNLLPPYAGLTCAVIIYSVGSGLIEVIISPIMEYLPTDDKSGNMAFLHSFFCWGEVFVVAVTTLLIKLLGAEKWGYIAVMWSVIPLIVMLLMSFVPIVEPKEMSGNGFKELLKSPLFIVMLVIMFLSGASEITVGNWMSAFAEQSLKLSKLVGDLVGPCLFAACMGMGRIIFSFIGDKIPMKRVLFVFSVFTVCAYLVLSLSKIPAVSLAAGVLVGLGVSVMWPGSLSLSASHFPNGATAMFALLAMFGDFGCSFGPWMAGMVADSKGLNTAFLFATVFPFAMVIILIFLNRKKAKR